MSDLTTALNLTLIGMGMTFASIGALVAGMYLLTALFREKPAIVETSAPTPAEVDIPAETAVDEDTTRYMAAAAAVATALAQARQTASRASKTGAGTAGAWNTYVRGGLLTQRAHYNALRSRNRR